MPWKSSKSLTSYFFSLLFLTSFFRSSLSAETTSLNQVITEGENLEVITDGETLVSSARAFELGFFSPDPSSNRRYLGIWFKSIPIQTVVWVANRESPLTDTTGVLSLTTGGNLILSNHIGIFWSTNTSSQKKPIVQLLDSGNLVLIEGSLIIWQSFNYPSNVFLPGMKLGWDSMTNLNRQLTSWKSPHDPSPGSYSKKLRMSGLAEILIWKNSVPWFRNGLWDGRAFGGIPLMRYDNYFAFQFVGNSHEVYFQFGVINISLTSFAILHSTGVLEHLIWVGHQWSTYWSFPSDQCDNYAACRSYGVCHLDSSFSCECLKGFEPRLTKDWALRDWSGGCLRRVELDCGLESSDGFVKVSRLKLPETSNASVNESMDLDVCRKRCLKDCSCKAFAMSGGRKCVIWFGDLVDIRHFANGGEDLYVRLAASELDSANGRSTKKNLMIIMMLIFGILSIIFTGLLLWKKKRTQGSVSDFLYDEISEQELDVTLFDIGTIKRATDSFSKKNILGEGGFGLVYKGRLVDGQEMAVKRLSNDSAQGLDEFKNEVVLIAKLQHRNLVQLLGCCIEGYERMLIYEYMPNRSLDALIFDKAKGASLDWEKRIDIIVGIARGLLYLHQDSRFNVIHRDLKASNILLDKEMNPKISDFGIARIFGRDKKQEHTKRVVGTYGYMSPEYAMGGVYSVKSDVFSFGVIVLEILSGKKNKVVYEAEPHMNLVGHAWRLWREDKSLELLDESLDIPCPESEILRCIQVGLLCVQEGRDDRPAMSSVVLMLGSKTAELPQPKRPGFCMRTVMESTPIYTDQSLRATNEVTITRLEGR